MEPHKHYSKEFKIEAIKKVLIEQTKILNFQ